MQFMIDILEQYEQEQKLQPARSTAMRESIHDAPFVIRLVIKVSRGRITDIRIANYVLLGIVVFFFLSAFMIFFLATRLPKSPPSRPLPPGIIDT